MTFKKNNISWNKGKTGEAAGWSEARRQQASERQKQYMAENPRYNMGGPSHWKTGPDPDIHKLYYRWLRSKAQARYWCQIWGIVWEDYLNIYKTAPGSWGRNANDLHLTRIDTKKGWTLDNVKLAPRNESRKRSNNVRKKRKDTLMAKIQRLIKPAK